MLFRESELTSVINTRSIFDEAYNLLSEAVYLTEDESFLSPSACRSPCTYHRWSKEPR